MGDPGGHDLGGSQGAAPFSPKEAEFRHDAAVFGTITWTAPLDWLEEMLPGSPVLADLRRSLCRSPMNPDTPVSVTPAAVRMPALIETCGNVALEVIPPILQPVEGANATPLSAASVRVSMSPPNFPGGSTNLVLAEKTPVLPQSECISTPIACAAMSPFPSNLSETGGSTSLVEEEASIFQQDMLTSLPVSVASPAPCELLSNPRELGGNIMEERKASILQRDEPGTNIPVSMASAVVLMSPINPTEVAVNVQASILDMHTSTPISVASTAAEASSPNVPETGANTSLEEKDSAFQQEECTSNPLPVVSLATRVPSPNPSEVRGGTSVEEETLVLHQDGFTTIPVSVVPAATCDSVSNPSKEEGTSSVPSAASTGDAISPLPNVVDSSSLEERASVLQKQGEYSSTPLAVASAAAWMSPLNFSEAGRGTSVEVKAPTPCPGEGSGVAPPGCWCHGAWTSPLSMLEAEVDGSVEERTSTFQRRTGTDVTTGPRASAEVWATFPNIPNMAVASFVQQIHKGTGTTPASVASTATWTSPPSLLGVGVNTSPAEKAATKDNTAETDSLLWRCSRDQLSGLSRAELEGRLESTLIIMEALSRQMRACQDRRAPVAQPGPSDQRDAGTQTAVSDPKEEERLYHDLYVALRCRHQALCRSRESERDLARQLDGAVGEMKAWISDSGTLLETVDSSYLRIQEDRRSLRRQQKDLFDLLSRCRDKLQRSGQKQAEMKEEMEKALRVKEAAEQVLESVREHAETRIRRLERSLDSQTRLHVLLQEVNGYKADLSLEYDQAVEEMDRRAMTLRDRWTQMRHDYETFTSVVARCLFTTKKMAAEVEAAREEVAQHREVCQKLEERTVEVVEALGRANDLTEANAVLERDLTVALQRANAAEREQAELHREKEGLSQQLAEAQGTIRKLEEEVARLSREKERVEQERDAIQRDAREVSDCREFIEQENRIVRRQLAETEVELKSTLATLRERSAQLEDLKDAHQALQEEQETLRGELAASEAEIRSAGDSMEAFSQSLLEIRAIHSQFLEMADFLRAALRGEEADLPQRRVLFTPARPTPHRLGSSFVESVLQAVAGKDSQTPGLVSETTAFTRATLTRTPTPSAAEVQDSFSTCVLDFQDVVGQIRLLISQRHEAVREEAQNLRTEISQLRQNLESMENQLQAEKEASSTNVAKLNKALRVRIQSENELQKLMRRQEERLQALSDQSREVALLQEEVSQLKYALEKSETEAAALWEQLRETKPSDTNWVQEKIWLRQEVRKLNEQLLHKDEERVEVLTKSLYQVRSLEAQLSHAEKVVREHERTEAEMKAVLSTLPPDLSAASEVRRLLELLT